MPTKLFIGCLPLKPEVTTDELSNYFGPYGKLDDVYIPKPYRYLHVYT
jgi:RNA recognition motif-containing protein